MVTDFRRPMTRTSLFVSRTSLPVSRSPAAVLVPYNSDYLQVVGTGWHSGDFTRE